MHSSVERNEASGQQSNRTTELFHKIISESESAEPQYLIESMETNPGNR